MKFPFFNKSSNNVQHKKSRSYYAVLNGMLMGKYSNKYDADKAIKENVIAFYCVDLISQQLSSVGLLFKDGERELPESHPLVRLFKSPYYLQTQHELLHNLTSNYLVYGNAFIKKANPGDNPMSVPIQMELYNSSDVTINRSSNALLPHSYTVTLDGNESTYPVSQVGISSIMHFRTSNICSYIEGQSPLMAASSSVKSFVEANNWNYSIMKNGARPSGVIQVPEGLDVDEDNIDSIRSQFEEIMSGSSNAGKPLVLSDGMQFSQLSMSPSDMDFYNLVKSNAHQIALALKVPMELLNTEQGKFENQSVAYERLWDDAVSPVLMQFLDVFNTQLCPLYGDNVYIELDIESVPAIRNKQLRLMQTLQPIDYLTVNEKRSRFGMDPLPGADQLLTELNKIPLDQVGFSIDNDIDNEEVEKMLKEKGLSDKYSKLLGKIINLDG